MIITITDIRRAGYCVAGARTWFRQHDLDFRSFIRDGLDVEIVLNTGDARAIDVVRKAKTRRDG